MLWAFLGSRCHPAKMSGKIFISYRRDDSAGWSGRLSDRLKNHFPSNQIFMDVDTLDPGVDFVEAIEEVVGACDVLIAVMGNRWLTSSDRRGRRRLDIAEDLVRLEIATALKRGIRVVPVLVEGAMMPETGELPDDLKALVRRNALEIGHIRFDADSEHLVNAVERALGKAREQRQAKENERLEAEQQERLDREQSERATVEIRERQEKEQLDARSREQERLEAEQRERERLEAEQHQREEKERLVRESQPQPPSPGLPVVLSAPPDKTKMDERFAESPKVVYPVPPEAEKSPPSSSGGTGGKSPSRRLISLLAIAVILVVGGFIYLAVRVSQSPPPSTAPIAAVTPGPTMTATPTQAAAVKPPVQPTATISVAVPNPSISPTQTNEELVDRALDDATKDHPWENTLGMKFVPVTGTHVLFSVWDTRVQDFEASVKSSGYDATGGMHSLGKDGWKQVGATWKEPGFSQGLTHPVVGVSWNDAVEFCKWLTKRERSAGNLPQDREYRLPRDEEWSTAVGLKDEVGSTPEEKSGKIELYPWDNAQKRDRRWPPPTGAGNYAGAESTNEDWPSRFQVIEGYNDGYPRTSPVGSFGDNFCGLYDMGGNVWQWCEDWYNAQRSYRVLRGASWYSQNSTNLAASFRDDNTPEARNSGIGFRCVVAVVSSR
jgi:formylglycine-generating enzyme required for sulfatase activity